MQDKWKRRAEWGCLIGALFAAHTCIQIEVRNARAGNFLPLPDIYFSEQARTDGIKWRQLNTSAQELRESYQVFKDMNMISDKMTEEEFVAEQIATAKTANSLRGWVSTWGLLQYVLVPAVMIGATLLLRKKGSWLSLAAFTIAFSSGIMAVYRGYYSSLGW